MSPQSTEPVIQRPLGHDRQFPPSPEFRFYRYLLCVVTFNHVDPAITPSLLGWHCKRCGKLVCDARNRT